MSQEPDAVRKKGLEDEHRHLANALEEHRQQAQRAQLRESELSGELRTEQARLDELSERLTSLERSLQPQ
jgi:chromosome segregation ATPase